MSWPAILRGWHFERLTKQEAIREVAIEKPYEAAILIITHIQGSRRDIEPYQLEGRVLVWVPSTRHWWLSPRGWSPRRELK